MRAELPVVANAEVGEVGVEPASEGGVGGGAAVDGEELFSLGAADSVEEAVGEVRVGVEGAAGVAFGEAVGLQGAPRWTVPRPGGGVEGGEPGGDLVGRGRG
ncbi:hypothetical protein Snoj_29350 [Streptomyces nojiriensis]|uniref:Uncharacterized protein n=1 Tax=Streptomyces nojiriensis TaxID=66374 RepID=A0ABQ3SM14_9ACTN|nr:hypothetical protein GCM10010205_77470 [Streptomyces nojiriensis]GHI69017.1 hypothetical protein Snoj_29350 [Streptomyces nojiriensis]